MNIASNITVDAKIINKLAKEYNTLDFGPRLVELLKSAFPNLCFESLSKHDLHKTINDLYIERYNGELVFKYNLFLQYHLKKNNVAAFEIKVNNSRADFLTINGYTNCYEIKTALDNFSKFKKQAKDYLRAFEFNHLFVDNKHCEKAMDILPETFGLWVYKDGKSTQIKKPKLNTTINPEVQLRLLTKPELLQFFPIAGTSIRRILNSYEKTEINRKFKKALKYRYSHRWNFIVEKKEEILPIDLQFFFNTTIQPSHIYFI